MKNKFWIMVILGVCCGLGVNLKLHAQEKDIITYLHLQNLNNTAIDDLQGGELKDGGVCANNKLYKSKNKHVYQVFGVQFLTAENRCRSLIVKKYGVDNTHSEAGVIGVAGVDYAGYKWDVVSLLFTQIPNLVNAGETVDDSVLVGINFIKYIDDKNTGLEALRSIRKILYDKYIYQYDNIANEYTYTWNIMRRSDSYYLTIHSETNSTYDCKIVLTYRSTKIGAKWQNTLSLSYGNLAGYAELLTNKKGEF